MNFEPVIGLEIHLKLKTKSKIFCGCRNDVFFLNPNEAVCPICMGFPGTLPVVNKRAIDLGILLALALQCEIQRYTKFDRKNYFYPDLPKGYQISQYDMPIALKGMMEFLLDNKVRNIGITRLHLEEDAGKLLHENSKTYVDLNRAGTPLAEIVTEPDFRSPQEVSAFLKELQQIARYLDVSHADMEKGEMRCDVNVSIRPAGQNKFGTKVEIKNMNSFSAIEKALEYEIKRQEAAIAKGEIIVQDTRGWNDEEGISESQRMKEEVHDYRYFPEPDLPHLHISEERIDALKSSLSELPTQKRIRYEKEYGIKEDDARILSTDKNLADYFEKTTKLCNDPLKSANIILSVLLYHMKEDGKNICEVKVKPEDIAQLIQMANANELSMSALKVVLEELYQSGGDPVQIITAKGLKQVNDASSIESICREVLNENTEVVAQYKSGKTKVFGVLVGQVMKKSGGKMHPGMVNEVLLKLLQ